MINRSKMRRQLYRGGGITRQRYGLGDFVRKLIPNEIADVAVKAAPFVAPFNPGIAGLMRGIGRYDQRGSLSDALKQGALTYGFGKGVGKLGGASGSELGNIFGRQEYTMKGFEDEGLGRLFDKQIPDRRQGEIISRGGKKLPTSNKRGGLGIVQEGVDFITSKAPILKKLPDNVAQKLLVGGAITGASALASYFKGDFRPQEEGESMEEYLAARKDVVGKQMRIYMDNYFKFDPEYSQLDDAGRNAFVARYNVAQGGRIGYGLGDLVRKAMPTTRQPASTSITKANTLAQNRAINEAQRQNVANIFKEARTRLNMNRPSQSQIQSEANRILHENLNQDTGGARGVAALVSGPPTQNDISAAIAANQSPAVKQTMPTHDMYGISFADHDKYSGRIARDPANLPQDFQQQQLDFFDRLNKAVEDYEAANKPSLQERMFGEDWNSLSDYDQYTIAKEYPGQTPPRRNPNFIPNMNQGGRVGLRHGTPEMGIKSLDAGAPDITYEGNEGPQAPMKMAEFDLKEWIWESNRQNFSNSMFGKDYEDLTPDQQETINIQLQMELGKKGPVLPEDPTKPINPFAPKPTGPVLPDKMMAAKGGRIGYRMGMGPAGLPGIPRMAPDGMEYDMRMNGGFQGLGAKEGKDDVPAMLAKNEFVFTADAVRGAGGGDIELGAQRMYDTMKNLEKRVV